MLIQPYRIILYKWKWGQSDHSLMLLGLFDATGTLTGLTGLLVGLAGLVGLTPTAVLDGNASPSSGGGGWAIFCSKAGCGVDGG